MAQRRNLLHETGGDKCDRKINQAIEIAHISCIGSDNQLYYYRRLRAQAATPAEKLIPGGDPERGVKTFVDYGCISCHVIPGVQRARGLVGPPLDSWSQRSFIAGQFENTPENLVSWLMAPQALIPGSAMPDMGVTWQDAQDMAAYLFTLESTR